MTKEEFANFCEPFLSRLREHFDSVQLIVTSHDEDRNSTILRSAGSGNMFARTGAVDEWLCSQSTEESEDEEGE